MFSPPILKFNVFDLCCVQLYASLKFIILCTLVETNWALWEQQSSNSLLIVVLTRLLPNNLCLVQICTTVSSVGLEPDVLSWSYYGVVSKCRACLGKFQGKCGKQGQYSTPKHQFWIVGEGLEPPSGFHIGFLLSCASFRISLYFVLQLVHRKPWKIRLTSWCWALMPNSCIFAYFDLRSSTP